MIKKNECMKYILDNHHGFFDHWDKHLDWWGDDTPGLSNDMNCFSDYTLDLISEENKDHSEIKKCFQTIEQLLIDGDKEVKNAAATCFLENILNECSSGTISPNEFTPYLGKQSKEYCQAWDKFTKCKTEGI